MTEFALLVLTVMVGVLAVLLWLLRRDLRRPGRSPSTDLVPTSTAIVAAEGSGSALQLTQERSSSGEVDAIIGTLGTELELLRIELDPPTPEDRSERDLVPVLGVVGPIVERAAELFPVVRDASALRITFSPETMAGLSSGQLQLMETARGSLAVAVGEGHRVVEFGTIVATHAVDLAAQAALNGVAAAAAVAFQVKVMRALDAIEAVGQASLGRHRDDDWGRLHAATALVDDVVDALGGLSLPDQFRFELAAASMDVEAIYRSRLRALRDLPADDAAVARIAEADDADEPAPDLSTDEEESGDRPPDRKALVATVKRIGAGIEGFSEEVDLVVAATLTRYRVQVARALAVAVGGDAVAAQSLLVTARQRVSADLDHLDGQMAVLLGLEAGRWKQLIRLDDGALKRIRPVATAGRERIADYKADVLDQRPALAPGAEPPALPPGPPQPEVEVLLRNVGGEWVLS